MGTTALAVEDLHKEYGDVRALSGISFSVEAGEIFGLVGPNGAGKTTTLQIVSTLLSATDGHASVFGTRVDEAPNETRERIRYLPEEAGAYDNHTGRQYLRFVAGFFGDANRIVERGVEIADLGDRIDDDAGEYSRGMTRKLLVASVLMTEPEVAILDEPTAGLDVRNARRVREAIKEYPTDGRAVVLSSHDMLEVSYLCDRIALLNEGRIVATGGPEDIVEEYDAENLEAAFLEATS